MRDLTIRELECVNGGVAPVVVAAVRGIVGGVGGVGSYVASSSIQEQPMSFSGAAGAFVAGAITGGGASTIRTGIISGTAGGLTVNALDGTSYSDGTGY